MFVLIFSVTLHSPSRVISYFFFSLVVWDRISLLEPDEPNLMSLEAAFRIELGWSELSTFDSLFMVG